MAQDALLDQNLFIYFEVPHRSDGAYRCISSRPFRWYTRILPSPRRSPSACAEKLPKTNLRVARDALLYKNEVGLQLLDALDEQPQVLALLAHAKKTIKGVGAADGAASSRRCRADIEPVQDLVEQHVHAREAVLFALILDGTAEDQQMWLRQPRLHLLVRHVLAAHHAVDVPLHRRIYFGQLFGAC